MTEEQTPRDEGVSVLFVCLGNICRSTMAEGVFREQAASNKHIRSIDSCGTGAYHTGNKPDSRTLSVLKDNNITDYHHKARKVRVPQDFQEFDYILAMDQENLFDLQEMAQREIKKGKLQEEALSRIQLYGAFGGKDTEEEIGDPYYGGRDGFEIAFKQVSRFGKGLLEHIEQSAASSSKI